MALGPLRQAATCGAKPDSVGLAHRSEKTAGFWSVPEARLRALRPDGRQPRAGERVRVNRKFREKRKRRTARAGAGRSTAVGGRMHWKCSSFRDTRPLTGQAQQFEKL